MGEEVSRQNRGWNREMKVNTNLSLDIDKYPTDLSLSRGFMSEKARGDDDESSIELNLGLSLGGKFGVDKTPKKLERSSSLIETMPFNDSRTVTVAEQENYDVGLVRTTSLPAEMEEEWRKRKEMQSVRRMEAKRRRCEKQSFKGGKFEDQTVSFEGERSGFLQRRLGCGDSNGGGGGGGSSSSLSELDNKTQQGSSNSCNNERSPKIVTGCSSNSGSHGTEQIMGTALFDMPCVFMNGPNGQRIDGILYKYGKGQEVRIMCICHGSFLTPAEFVKHGGGGDVDRPLRHIVVNTSSSRF